MFNQSKEKKNIVFCYSSMLIEKQENILQIMIRLDPFDVLGRYYLSLLEEHLQLLDFLIIFYQFYLEDEEKT